MSKVSNEKKAFLALLRAGLWEQDVQLSQYGNINHREIYRLAEEQSVVGLVAAGLEHAKDAKVSQLIALQYVGSSLQLEQKNRAMNSFIAKLINRLREENIYCLLIKGQGIAQCYERPLWRACGDVDLLLSSTNYKEAKEFLIPMSENVESEHTDIQHIGMTIESFEVELHGSIKYRLGRRIDKVLEEIHRDLFYQGSIRFWMNGQTQIFLPSANNDVIIVFTHVLKHFFKGGIGLRQLCDWCRLLWTYKNDVDKCQLEKHLKEMKLMSEWKSFASVAVDWMGMPANAMPFYSSSPRWKFKAQHIVAYILEVGNFGHNRDKNYVGKYPFLLRKFISFYYHTIDSLRHSLLFPLDAFRMWCMKIKIGVNLIKAWR